MYQKQSGKLDSDGKWRCGSIGQESSTARGIPCDAFIKLSGLFLVVISNTFCCKTFKEIVFCHNEVLLYLYFFLLLFSSASFNHNLQKRHFQRYIPK